MAEVVKLRLVVPDRARAVERENRAAMHSAVRDVCHGLAGSVHGYALVAWDKTGEPFVSMAVSDGPVGYGLVPTLVGDVLGRFVARHASVETVDAPDPSSA